MHPKDMMDRVVSEEKVDKDAALPVFSSSVDMFMYIKKAVGRCKALTTGETFFRLHEEFQTCLQTYANILVAKLPQAVMIQTFGCEGYRYSVCVSRVCRKATGTC
jgi:hypothetical protein